jgi:hypothetical protein
MTFAVSGAIIPTDDIGFYFARQFFADAATLPG